MAARRKKTKAKTTRRSCGKGKEFVSFASRQGRVTFCAKKSAGKRKAAPKRRSVKQCRVKTGPRRGQFKRCR